MSNAALKIPEPDMAEEHEGIEVIIQVRSIKNDCNTSYLMTEQEIHSYGVFQDIVKLMKRNLRAFIQEKRHGEKA